MSVGFGFIGRKKLYAFKQKIGELVKWAAETRLRGVTIWADKSFLMYELTA